MFDIMKKSTLTASMAALLFLLGCDAEKIVRKAEPPNFTIEEAESVCEKILHDNIWTLSDDGGKSFKLFTLAYQKDLGRERQFTAVYLAKRHGNLYKITSSIYVGKDAGGWYAEMAPDKGSDRIKFRKGNKWKEKKFSAPSSPSNPLAITEEDDDELARLFNPR